MSDSVMRTCPSCGAQNRVPARRLADTGRCGACKAPLPPVDQPIAADPATFEKIVGEARVPVLVDFWAAWCRPCHMASPEVEAIAREMAGKVIVLKVDTEAHPALAARYRVQGLPTFMVFSNGRPVLQRAGAVPRTVMRGWLDQAMAA